MNKISHLAIIMDGNKRWSKLNHTSLKKSYDKGFDKLFEISNYCIKANIKYLSVFALSTENIQRQTSNIIFELIENKYKKLLTDLSNNNEIKIKIIGEKDNLSKKITEIISKIEVKNYDNYKLQLNIAFNYGSNFELLDIITKINNLNLENKKIDLSLIKKNMYLGDIPEPDLLIRTGGHKRLSNFLLLYMNYTELSFTNTLWPDFTIQEMKNAINKFSLLERKYGL